MFRAIYTFGLILLSFVWLARLFKKKYRKTLALRLGWKVPSLSSTSPHRIWVHAVSLGETKAIIPLLKQLKKIYPEAFIIFSTLTETGYRAAKEEFPEADRHLFLPFDLWSRSYVREARPTLVLLCETDFWYHFLDESKRQGARVILVNGKLSLKSLKLYRRFPAIFRPFDRLIVQGDEYKRRFLSLGIPEEKIFVGGNIKIDAQKILPEPLPFDPPILVIGSTHDPEEQLLLKALGPVWEKHPRLKVILVPRHPERFETVAKLLETLHLPYARLSQNSTSARLTLADFMGSLKELYRQSTLCIVAGSWTSKVGGHNILEPAFFGKPVIFGPYMHSQPDFCEQVLEARAGLQLSLDKLSQALIDLLDHPEKARALGKAGLELIQKNQGALNKTLDLIQPLC